MSLPSTLEFINGEDEVGLEIIFPGRNIGDRLIETVQYMPANTVSLLLNW
jgi:hypothetical protein